MADVERKSVNAHGVLRIPIAVREQIGLSPDTGLLKLNYGRSSVLVPPGSDIGLLNTVVGGDILSGARVVSSRETPYVPPIAAFTRAGIGKDGSLPLGKTKTGLVYGMYPIGNSLVITDVPEGTPPEAVQAGLPGYDTGLPWTVTPDGVPSDLARVYAGWRNRRGFEVVKAFDGDGSVTKLPEQITELGSTVVLYLKKDILTTASNQLS